MVFFGIVFALSVFLYFSRHKKVISYKLLVISVIGFRFFYALLLTIGQYYVWSKNGLTQLLLNAPLDKSITDFSFLNFGYFLFYSYGRFWLNVFIAVAVAFVFYSFLKFLKKYQERFFEEGETELGFLAALIVGWPNFVVFLPLVFVSVVLISLFRRLILKEIYTTLGWPFVLATLITLIWGNKLIQILNLGVLRI